MGKVLCLILSVAISVILCACGEKAEEEVKIPEDNAAVIYDNTVRYTPDEDGVFAPSDEADGGFTVKDRIFTYNSGTLLLFHVTNETDENYSFVINVSYIDKSGNTLSSEVRSYSAFTAGYEKYFLFEPGIVFESCEYEVKITPTDGDCWQSIVTAESTWIEPVQNPLDSSERGYQAVVHITNET